MARVSLENNRPQLPLVEQKMRPHDPAPGKDVIPIRSETSPSGMIQHYGAAALRSMAMRQALETCGPKELSELPPVLLASVSKSMWATVKILSDDANRWRLMRRRACLLDRRMLDGPYRVLEIEDEEEEDDDDSDEMDTTEGDSNPRPSLALSPRERLAAAMDRVAGRWTAVPYSDELAGPEERKEHVFDSADFYVEAGRVRRVRGRQLLPGQRRWEKEISAQLLLYRLCLVFQRPPTVDAGAWLFILRRCDSAAEIWFADRGNFHWFVAVCPDPTAWNAVVELLELLISDRCVIRYGRDGDAEHPTAGETMGAAWSR